MTTVGLFNKDSQIYFINRRFAVINNPHNGNVPTLIKRSQGEPLESDWIKIHSILKSINMELKGDSFKREDGLWCSELKGGE